MNEIKIEQSNRWHLELLEKIAYQNLLPGEIVESLKEYMGFRHFYRHSYGFMIDEELLAPLMDNIKAFVKELREKLILCGDGERAYASGDR
jgi:hypothetical protein